MVLLALIAIDWTLIITGLISALSGGALASFLTFKLGNRKQDESEFATLVKEYKELTEGYKKEVIELRTKVDFIEKELVKKDAEITQLRHQLLIFESSHVDIPVPVWLKDIDGKMLFLNDEYERSVLQPANKNKNDYIGHTDIDVWGEKAGKEFQANDRKVMRSKKSIEFEETWETADGIKYIARVIKYPRFLNRTVIGIGGIIIDSKIQE